MFAVCLENDFDTTLFFPKWLLFLISQFKIAKFGALLSALAKAEWRHSGTFARALALTSSNRLYVPDNGRLCVVYGCVINTNHKTKITTSKFPNEPQHVRRARTEFVTTTREDFSEPKTNNVAHEKRDWKVRARWRCSVQHSSRILTDTAIW